MACPALRRAAKRSMAGVAQTGSAPAATMSVGVRTASAKRGSCKRPMRRKAASVQAMVGSPIAPSPIAVASAGVAGIADAGRSVRRLPANGLVAIDVSPPPGTKLLPKPSQRSSRAAGARHARDPDQAQLDHRARWRRAARTAASPRGRPTGRWRRPWSGRGRNAASASAARGPAPGSPRGRAGSREKSRTWPLLGVVDLASRAALPAPVEGHDREAAPAQLDDRLEIASR